MLFPPRSRKVDVRLPGKGNSNSLGARPVHLIITIIKWIRTSRLSIENSLSSLLAAVAGWSTKRHAGARASRASSTTLQTAVQRQQLYKPLSSEHGTNKPDSGLSLSHLQHERLGNLSCCSLLAAIVRNGSWTGPPRGRKGSKGRN